MTNVTNKDRQRMPVISLLRGDQLTSGQKAGIWIGMLLTACAVGVFIYLIVQASEVRSARGIVMAASFVLFAVGLFYFFLARINNPRRAWIVLYVTVPLAVAAFVVSLYLDGGAQAPLRDSEQAKEIENVYDASDGTVVQDDGNLD